MAQKDGGERGSGDCAGVRADSLGDGAAVIVKQRTPPAPQPGALEVLKELVECEGVSDIGKTVSEWASFKRRHKKAWSAARAILSAPAPEGQWVPVEPDEMSEMDHQEWIRPPANRVLTRVDGKVYGFPLPPFQAAPKPGSGT